MLKIYPVCVDASLDSPIFFIFVLFFSCNFIQNHKEISWEQRNVFSPKTSSGAQFSKRMLPLMSKLNRVYSNRLQQVWQSVKRGKGEKLYLKLLATAETAEHAFASRVYPIIHQEVNRNYDLSNGHLCPDIKLAEGGKISNPLHSGAGNRCSECEATERYRSGLFSGCFGLPQSRGRFASASHPTARGTRPEPGTNLGEGLAGFCGRDAAGTGGWLSESQVLTPR